MLARLILGSLIFIAVSGPLGNLAWGQNEGQTTLDQALELAVAPESVSDLTKIIELCQSAMKQGLDEGNANFAAQLLSSTLVRRGTIVSKTVLKGDLSNPRFRERFVQMRQIALRDLNAALKLEPEMPQAHYLLGRLLSLPGGDRAQAIEHLDEALRLSTEDNLLQARALVARGDVYTEKKKRLADYNAAIELAPLKAEIRLARGKFFLQQRQMDSALEDFSIAIEEAPDDAEIYQARGVTFLAMNRLDEALADLDQSIKLDPNSSLAYTHRARIHLINTNPMAAVSDLDKALTANQLNPVAYLLRANAYHQLKNNDKAIADVKRVLEIQPESTVAQRMYAALLANSDQLDKAIEELTESVKETPDKIPSLTRLAMLYVENRDLASAIETYTAILEISPNNQGAYHRRADAYLFSGEQVKAIADYNSALRLVPNDSEVLNNLAWTLATSPDERLRDGKRAIELATKACEITEYRKAHILSTLAAAHAEAGDFEMAVEWSAKAVAMGDEPRQEQLAKELESYKAGEAWREVQTQEKPEESAEEEPDDEPTSDEPTSDEPKPTEDTPEEKPEQPSPPPSDSDDPPADDDDTAQSRGTRASLARRAHS